MIRGLALVVITVAMTGVPSAVPAGVISKACLQSDRSKATPELCSCIQGVANQSLTRAERRKVSKFFSDPHRAQELRMSNRRADEKLWERYKAFGERARETCG